jgi:hypothetical protein
VPEQCALCFLAEAIAKDYIMNTFFVRHSSFLAVSKDTLGRLWDDRLVAIHYPEGRDGKYGASGDNESFDPADYTGYARRSMGILCRLAEEGGYVCAQYYGRTELLLGTVAPGTDVRLFRCEWREGGRAACLKTLQLQNIRVLDPRDHAIIAASRPRQGTIAQWHAVGGAVAAIIEGREQAPSWGLLSSARQEVACSEFLRLQEAAGFGLPRLRSLLLPVGRTLRDVDFIGLAEDGKRIFAQVTSSLLEHAVDNGKLARLKQFVGAEQAHVLLFCACKAPAVIDGVKVFPVAEVFSTLNATDCGRAFLRGVEGARV